jgi:DNA-binding MarR family transcriptional regulator
LASHSDAAEPGSSGLDLPPRHRPLTEDLLLIDAALLGLRHLWSMPAERPAALGGVEMSTVWVVEALDRAGSSEGLSVAELAEALDVAHSTASRLVDRAREAGMVIRERSLRDARRAMVTLTPEGRELANESRAFRLYYLAQVTATWTPADHGNFAVLLARFADAARSRPPATAETRGTPQ